MTTTFDASPLNLWVWGEVAPAMEAIVEYGRLPIEDDANSRVFDVAWKSSADSAGENALAERVVVIAVERKKGVDRLVQFGTTPYVTSGDRAQDGALTDRVPALPEPADVDISSVDAFMKSVNLVNKGKARE